MSENDVQIKKLLDAIETKREKLGKKPRMSLKTNGLLKTEDGKAVNINAVNTLDGCVDAISKIVVKYNACREACTLLNIECTKPEYSGFTIEDWIEDFKLKSKIITWSLEDKKIKALESKLKDLRSEDLKTADALSDIANSLDI